MSDQAKINALQRNVMPTKAAYSLLQRKCACGTHTIAGGECESCRKEKASVSLQRAAVKAGAISEAPPIVHDDLRSPRRTLDAATRAFMEPRFSHDFSRVPAHPTTPIQTRNNTGLPDALKSGIENLSGLSMDDVRVHYNSSEPSRLQALAYTRGAGIHIAPGQERYLSHEAWHVVQQQRGRVKPTVQAKGVAINDDAELEREADVMGMEALRVGRALSQSPSDAAQN